eukprot:3044183-Pleurochrysis_carterae.AAC.1
MKCLSKGLYFLIGHSQKCIATSHSGAVPGASTAPEIVKSVKTDSHRAWPSSLPWPNCNAASLDQEQGQRASG